MKDQLSDIDNTLFTNRQTIEENNAALSKAKNAREQADLEAEQERQEKYREIFNARLELISNLSGAMADMFRMEAQNAGEGTKRQKAALKAYKAFAITQTITDT